MTKISAVVPAYNAENYILRCLSSLLEQTMAFDEIIVIDDGSDDETSEIVSKMQKDFDSIVLMRTKNRGLSAARNLGFSNSKGDIIFFLDSDDWFAPSHVEGLVNLMEKKNCEIGFSGIVYVEESRSRVATFSLPSASLPEKTRLEPKELAANLYSMCTPATWSKAYRRGLLERVGPLNETLYYAEDVEFFIRVFAESQSLGFLREYTIYYDRRTGYGESKMSNNRRLIRKELSNSINGYLQASRKIPMFAQHAALRLTAKVMRYELRKLGAFFGLLQALKIAARIGPATFLQLFVLSR